MNSYEESWFRKRQGGVADSSRTIVPYVIDLVDPGSVVDVGCGTGGWLATFREAGVERVFGVDGEWVPLELLSIPRECFAIADLRRPLEVEERFDLAISLEVGEHLPHETSEQFVRSLTSLAPVVLFSAAVPGQPGNNHINPQWPSYWAERFERCGYQAVDAIRPWAWEKDSIKYFYRQNTIVFVDSTGLQSYPKLATIASQAHGPIPEMVHPRLYEVYLSRDPRRRVKQAIGRIALRPRRG